MSALNVWEDIFLLNLVLLFGKPKFRFRPWKTVSSEMLEMWKMKNVTLFSLDEQQSNGPFYLLLSDRFTTFAPAGIYAIAPNRQIYTKWNLDQMIHSCVHLLCLFAKRIGSPVIRGKANKKEARRRVERFDRSIFALTRCSKLSSFVVFFTSNLQRNPLTKNTFH